MKRISLIVYTLLYLMPAYAHIGPASVLSHPASKSNEVVVMCINDFHGAFVRDDFKGIPGAAAVVETLDSLKRLYPQHVVVSAGDNFGGSFFYQATRSQSLLPQFFKDCGITLSGVGNHEFDEGQDLLLDQWRTGVECRPQSWNIEYVSANIRCTADNPMRQGESSRPQFCVPFSVCPIALRNGSTFNLAFVGMSTSSTPRQTSASKVKGLAFEGNVQSVIDSLRKLPEYGTVEKADARILLTHQGTMMKSIRRGDILMQSPAWDDADSLYLSHLDNAHFCGVLSSHSHRPVAGTINDSDIPVTQGWSYGRIISLLRLEIDPVSHEVLSVTPQLVPVSPKENYSPKAARLQAQVNELLYTTHTKGGAALGEVLTTAKNNIPFDRSEMRHDQTYMGQLVSRSYIEALRQNDGFDAESLIVGVTHLGGIRAGLQAGPVRVMNVGEVLPFDNKMRVFRVSGRQLRDLIEYGLHNERYGYLQFAALKVDMNKKGHVKKLTYVLPSGAFVPIKDNTTCYIVADEFVSAGGDGYNPTLFPSAQEVEGLTMPRITDAFINYLRTQEEI